MRIPLLGFRVAAGEEQPTATLVSKISEISRDSQSPIPDLPAPPYQSVSEKGRLGDVLSLQLLRRLS